MLDVASEDRWDDPFPRTGCTLPCEPKVTPAGGQNTTKLAGCGTRRAKTRNSWHGQHDSVPRRAQRSSLWRAAVASFDRLRFPGTQGPVTPSLLYDARLVARSATEAIVSADDGGSIVFWNEAAERMFGCLEADALGKRLSVLISDNNQAVERVLAEPAGGSEAAHSTPFVLPGRRRDGARFSMEIAASRWRRDGERYVTLVVRDAAERDSIDALRQSEARFRSLVERSPEAIVVHAGGAILYANPAFAAMIGAASAAELAGLHVVDLVHPESRSLLARRRQQESDGASHLPTAYRVMHRDGRTLAVEATTVPSVYNGRPTRQTHLRDVTAQRALEAELAHQAFHDALTGLSNRSLFCNRVDHAIERARRTGSPPAVLFLDLDNFKSFNDGLGHSAGDELLVAVARRLNAAMRGSDTCARLGGDEFAVLIEDARSELDVAANAAHVASRLIGALTVPCRVRAAEVLVTVSVGIAVATGDDTVDDLLRNADAAMYRAKVAGSGRYELYRLGTLEVMRR